MLLGSILPCILSFVNFTKKCFKTLFSMHHQYTVINTTACLAPEAGAAVTVILSPPPWTFSQGPWILSQLSPPSTKPPRIYCCVLACGVKPLSHKCIYQKPCRGCFWLSSSSLVILNSQALIKAAFSSKTCCLLQSDSLAQGMLRGHLAPVMLY